MSPLVVGLLWVEEVVEGKCGLAYNTSVLAHYYLILSHNSSFRLEFVSLAHNSGIRLEFVSLAINPSTLTINSLVLAIILQTLAINSPVLAIISQTLAINSPILSPSPPQKQKATTPDK